MRYFLLLILLVGCESQYVAQGYKVREIIETKVKVDCVNKNFKEYCEHSFKGARYCTRYKQSMDYNYRISCDLYDALKGDL